ncbi:MAG: GNAT family N-acetyltransferase [Taibaiella sp.]|nr:GNAT family N-acetyltransferase [Taibaiella sp.]
MSDGKLSFSKYEAQDFENYYSIVKQDDVMRYISGKGLTAGQARAKFLSILEQGRAEEALGYFKVYKEDGIFIGDCKLVHYKHDPSVLEIGYILKPEYWGKGYGAMIGQKMLALADEVAPSKDIIGLIDPDNKASKKLLEKFGFSTCFLGIEDDVPTEKLMLKRS